MTSSPRIPFFIHDFLNAVPVIYPVCERKVSVPLDLRLSTPSQIAGMLGSGTPFAGVVPSVALFGRDDLRIVDSFCISSKGKVRTVCFYSRHPMKEVSSVLLDGRSNTSHLMLKVIFRLMNVPLPEFIVGAIDRNSIGNLSQDGLLVIGDDNVLFERELSRLQKYDMGELWYSLTGAKFVHAVTVTNREENAGLLQAALQECIDTSFRDFDGMLHYAQGRYRLEKGFCEEYLRETIKYRYDDEAKEGLKRFLDLSVEHGVLGKQGIKS